MLEHGLLEDMLRGSRRPSACRTHSNGGGNALSSVRYPPRPARCTRALARRHPGCWKCRPYSFGASSRRACLCALPSDCVTRRPRPGRPVPERTGLDLAPGRPPSRRLSGPITSSRLSQRARRFAAYRQWYPEHARVRNALAEDISAKQGYSTRYSAPPMFRRWLIQVPMWQKLR